MEIKVAFASFVIYTVVVAIWLGKDVVQFLRCDNAMNSFLEAFPDLQWDRNGYWERFAIEREFENRGGPLETLLGFQRARRRLLRGLFLWGGGIFFLLVLLPGVIRAAR